MQLIGRIIVAGILLLVAAFCVFGFLATFEPPAAIAWRVGYAAVGGLCIIGVLLICCWRGRG